MAHVGGKIRAAREAKDWTLDFLADSCDVDRVTLNRIELGKQKPRRATLRSIGDALGVDLAETRATRQKEREKHGPQRRHVGGGARAEDRIADLLDYLRTLDGKQRSEFIRAIVALLTALEHARPVAAGGASSNDGR